MASRYAGSTQAGLNAVQQAVGRQATDLLLLLPPNAHCTDVQDSF
jgi:hypothetical protein